MFVALGPLTVLTTPHYFNGCNDLRGSVVARFTLYLNNRTQYVRLSANQIDYVGDSVWSASGFGSVTSPVLTVHC